MDIYIWTYFTYMSLTFKTTLRLKTRPVIIYIGCFTRDPPSNAKPDYYCYY